MRRLLLCSAASVALCAAAPALGADLRRMPVKAPVMVAPVFFSWNGFYIGGNVGYGFGETDVFTEGQVFVPNQVNVNAGARPQDVRLEPDGFTGGIQLGYNFQVGGGWVFGIETDINYTDFRDDVTVITTIPGFAPRLNNVYHQELEFLGTLRGRIGYAFDRTLFYVTGGLAYGGVDNSVNLFGTDGNVLQFSGRDREIKVGYAVGGGIEHAFTPNWSVKLEYLYYDLGRDDLVAINNVNGPAAAGGPGYNSFFDNSGSIVRVGLNYRFGGGPVMASF